MPLPSFHLAAWSQDRINSCHLKAKLAALEEELERMGAAPVHEEVNNGKYESHRCSAHSERGLIHGWSCALSRFPLSLKKAGSFLASFSYALVVLVQLLQELGLLRPSLTS
jgi:hypothetical protein